MAEGGCRSMPAHGSTARLRSQLALQVNELSPLVWQVCVRPSLFALRPQALVFLHHIVVASASPRRGSSGSFGQEWDLAKPLRSHHHDISFHIFRPPNLVELGK